MQVQRYSWCIGAGADADDVHRYRCNGRCAVAAVGAGTEVHIWRC